MSAMKMSKTVYICAGEELRKLLKVQQPALDFIPFNEAMIQGDYSDDLFSNEFIRLRSTVHHVSEADYRQTMGLFLTFLEHLNDVSSIELFFGEEPFCTKNVEVLLETLNQRGYQGTIRLNTVDETNAQIINSKTIR